ncbi:hypothetical protein BLNAU_11033 [Blattamonas nauphoetae]|uniref:P-loop containing nucleoside triphosphate hydrolase protein n=1 Tax=Blattamonas nauphoetae TaxID=2049346 RepID=A0ABQ9XSX3_9EUKA|nr:hypothetical protein BLNAU_11033 [Blattamonas nauphoetae]
MTSLRSSMVEEPERLPFVFRVKPVTDDDIWDIQEKDTTKRNHKRAQAGWEKRVHRYEQQIAEATTASHSNTPTKPVKKPSMLAVIIGSMGGWPVFFATIFLLLQYVYSTFIHLFLPLSTSVHILEPAMMSLVVLQVEKKGDDPSVPFPWAAGIIMILCPFIHTVMDVWAKAIYYHYSTQVRAGLSSLIFDKTMKLSLNDDQDSNRGQLLSLIAADSRNLAELLPDCFHLPLMPIQVIVPLIIVCTIWGASGLMSMAAIVVIIPIQLFLLSLLSRSFRNYYKHNDIRNKTTTETMEGIRTVKCGGMEKSFINKIENIRKQQVNSVFAFTFLTQCSSSLFTTLPLLVRYTTMVVVISTRRISQESFGTDVIPILGYLTQMTEPGDELPILIQNASLLYVGQKRIRDFLLSKELGEHDSDIEMESDTAIKIEKADFAWDQSKSNDDKSTETTKQSSQTTPTLVPTLKNVSLSVKKGSLTMIVGKVGSGKSSLAAAIVGEMTQTQGKCAVSGSVAYCPQAPWIANTTVRENITFGLPFDQTKFDETIRVCSLLRDLKELPAHDLTEIGERGTNLSGGQKARVQLARAVYADRDVYVLDSPLSAMDAKVAKEVMAECICGKLKGKTILLVTNNTFWVSKADQILNVENNEVIDQQLRTASQLDLNQPKIQPAPSPSPQPAPTPTLMNQNQDENNTSFPQNDINETNHLPEFSLQANSDSDDPDVVKAGSKMIVDEEYMTKSVPIRAYFTYFNSLLPLPLLILFIVLVALPIGIDAFATYWLGVIGTKEQIPSMGYPVKLTIYGILSAGLLVVLLLRTVIAAYAAKRSGTRIHNEMLNSVMRTPTSFFDTNPMGRVLNRFTGDLTQIDQLLLFVLINVVGLWLNLIGSIIINSIDYVLFLAIGPPILVIFVILLVLYARASRNLQRLESLSRSSTLSMFGECLSHNGLSTIRLYNQTDEWKERFAKKNDDWTIRFLLYQQGRLWSSLYASIISSLYMCGVVLFGWNFMSPVKLAVAIDSAMGFSHYGQELVRQNVDLDSRMTSFERVMFYSRRLPHETTTVSQTPPPDWPSEGKIEFENVSFRYRMGLPLILKNVSFEISPGESVGVCGRTGAGKTSLVAALFRLVELDPELVPDELDVKTGLPHPRNANERNEGRILIDGVDISKLELARLRQSISLIPQEPTVFTNSIRANIDLEGRHSDEEIWNVLNLVQMDGVVREFENGLDHNLVDGGESLSTGQKQLLCFARALLNNSKILVLDEATANIDDATDRQIQQTIREQFRGKTVIVIAHRLNTIIDLDKILVMNGGQNAEFGSPAELMEDQNSYFNTLLKSMGDEENIVEM